MVLNQQRLRLQLAKAGSCATHLTRAPNTGTSSPFCLRGGSNPTYSELYRQTAPTDHAHQLSFSACGSNRVAWFNRVDLLLWGQRAWHDCDTD
jgi:hypothetical protein